MKERKALDLETFTLTPDDPGKKDAVHWLTGRIVAAGIAGDKLPQCFVAQTVEDETELLRRSVHTLHGFGLYTWNGYHFDLPFFAGRCLVHGIHLPKGFTKNWSKRWETEEHYDVKRALGETSFSKNGLTKVAKALGVLPPDSYEEGESGKDVDEWVRAGDWDRVRKRVLADATTSYALGCKVEVVGPAG